MRRILHLDILLLVSGIARKHRIVPKPFSGHPQYPPPPGKKSIFFLEQEISQEREFVAPQIGDYKKMFLIVQTYLGGQSYYFHPFSFSPPNQVSFSWSYLLIASALLTIWSKRICPESCFLLLQK
jgi:hypothetical protein